MREHTIKMPDIGEGIAEVELAAWHVKVGDTVIEDQVLADVMTDKATVEIPSPVAGSVAWLGGEAGQVFAVGAALIRIETQGDGPATSKAAPAVAPTENRVPRTLAVALGVRISSRRERSLAAGTEGSIAPRCSSMTD